MDSQLVHGMRQTTPLCSVILPVYNSAAYIDSAIASVLEQTEVSLELIVIDDASTDTSSQKLDLWEQRDSRIRKVHNARNVGVAETRNRGIAMARGKYIAFLDSDDIWMPQKLKQQIPYMEQQQWDFCCTAYQMVDAAGQFLKQRNVPEGCISFFDLLKENYICCSSVVLRADLAKQHTMQKNYAHEDYVYWLELLQQEAKGYALNQVLVNYRLVQNGRSANKWRAAKDRWSIYRTYLGYSTVKSLRYFVPYVFHGIQKYW